MTDRLPDHETWLEAGLAVLGLGVLAGLIALLVGRLGGDAGRSARHAEQAPTAGSVPDQRHQNIAGPSPR
jgi:hypothetical protein